MAIYEGFEIFVSQVLGSGQTVYQVKGIDYDYGRRGGVTTIGAAKIIIDKYLDQYVAPIATEPIRMSNEMLDQLNAGTVALWENQQLQDTIDKLKEGYTVIKEDVANIDLTRLEALRDKIQTETQNLIDIQASIVDVRAEVTSAVGEQIQGLTDKFNQITEGINTQTGLAEGMTDSLEDSKEVIEGAITSFGESIASFQDSFKSVLDDLKNAQSVGWMKMIPIYVAGGLAIIVGVKVLDVMD